uniref:Large ribosomal subunit protein uL3m n=1 Tax=Panagrolaimus sp. ES5 TaxID=591445 RepID=A0AC34FTR2_9BILA
MISVPNALPIPSLCRISSTIISQKRFRRRVASLGPYNLVYTLAKDGSLDSATVEKIAQAYRDVNFVEKKIKDLPEPGTQYTQNSRRFGMVGIKIGMLPQWGPKGERMLCTAIHFPDNQVVDVVDPVTWYKTSPVGKRKAFGRFGPLYKVTVGAKNIPPFFLGNQPLGIFKKWGIQPKEYLGSFLTSEDALVQPGTKLDVRHFNIGQYVSVSGQTIDWGFQGAMHRWGFRGMPALRTTKSHRRVGSIGSKGDARVWPGKRMPGHMGFEWRQMGGLEVIRINPTENVIYVKGNVPGDNQYPVIMGDCMAGAKRVVNPPFPTYLSTIEEEDENETVENVENVQKYEKMDSDKAFKLYGYDNVKTPVFDITSKDIYNPNVFNFSSPSVVFTEADEKKSAARDKMRAKIAKVKK